MNGVINKECNFTMNGLLMDGQWWRCYLELPDGSSLMTWTQFFEDLSEKYVTCMSLVRGSVSILEYETWFQ